MKKVVRKLNRVLSVLLTAAMVVGSAPQTSLVVRAEGPETEGITLQSEESSVVESSDEESADEMSAIAETASDEGTVATEPASSEADSAEVMTSEDATTSEDAGTEEDKESETAPAETEEAGSTEASEDNTAGKEDAAIEEIQAESVTVSIDTAGAVKDSVTKISSATADGEDVPNTFAEIQENKITLEDSAEGKKLYLKIELAEGYEVTVTRDDSPIETVEGQTGYVYNLGQVTANTTIKVTTSRKKYSVITKVMYTANDSEEAEETSTAAVIKYDKDDDKEVVVDGKIEHGKTLSFTVTPGDETKRITAVKWKYDTEEGKDAILSGEYKIENVANNIVITIEVADLNYNVTAKLDESVDGKGKEVTFTSYKIGDGAAVSDEGKLFKLSGDDGIAVLAKSAFTLTFTLTNKENNTNETSVQAIDDIVPVVSIAVGEGATAQQIVLNCEAAQAANTYTATVPAGVITAKSVITVGVITELAGYEVGTDIGKKDEVEVATIDFDTTLYDDQDEDENDIKIILYDQDLRFTVIPSEKLTKFDRLETTATVDGKDVPLDSDEEGFKLDKKWIKGKVVIKIVAKRFDTQDVTVTGGENVEIKACSVADEKYKDQPDEDNKYTAIKGKEFFVKFRVADGYKPVIKIGGEDAPDNAVTADGIYSILKFTVEEDTAVVITAEDNKPKANIYFERNQVEIVSAYVGSEELDVATLMKSYVAQSETPETVDGETVTTVNPGYLPVSLKAGQSVTITAQAQAGYEITAAKADNKAVKVSKNSVTLTVSVGKTANIDAKAVAKENYTAKLSVTEGNVDEDVPNAADGIYNLNCSNF